MSGTDIAEHRLQKEISELSMSISGLVASFRKLRNPLAESRKKVPLATSQLDKISKQTEAAAHQMLDKIEKITRREEEVISTLRMFKERAEKGECDVIIAEADIVIEKANVNLNDAYTIMDALQFQDITAQQMDHAASLLEDVESKLHSILSDFGSGDSELALEASTRKDRAFDPHADLFDKKTNQKDIDSLFEQPNRE